MLNRQPMSGAIGIGHPRWQLMGDRLKPRASAPRGRCGCGHNGSIEKLLDSKRRSANGELILARRLTRRLLLHLVAEQVERGVASSMPCAERYGNSRSYALLFLNRRDPERLIVAKNSTPIVIGWGEGETFIASDIPALLDYTRESPFSKTAKIGEVKMGSYSCSTVRQSHSATR